MIGADNLGMARWRMGFALLALLATLLSALVCGSRSLAAEAPYEPNDTMLSAAGPLAIDQTYVAALETSSDRDFFFFYVTSANAAQVVLTVKNLGGGTKVSNLGVRILDSSATPVGAFAYAVGEGEGRTAAVTLKPQKYFIEVAPGEGYGDTYSLTAGGGDGAFGLYSRIAARCANATAAVEAARTGLGRARAKLQRATARLRRTRYGTHNARESARTVYREAKARLTAKRKALKAAAGAQQPWCSIPQ